MKIYGIIGKPHPSWIRAFVEGAQTNPVQCEMCREKWKRDPRLEVPCPVKQCQAKRGKLCRHAPLPMHSGRPSGHWFDNQYYLGFHREREQLAIKQGFLTGHCGKLIDKTVQTSAPAAGAPNTVSARQTVQCGFCQWSGESPVKRPLLVAGRDYPVECPQCHAIGCAPIKANPSTINAQPSTPPIDWRKQLLTTAKKLA